MSSLKNSTLAFWSSVLFIGLTLLTVYYSVRQSAEQRLQQETRNRMTQLVNQLGATLGRHAYLPALLAENPEIQAFLQTRPPAVALQEQLNPYLAKINRIAATHDIYLLDTDGTTVAASNWDSPASFMGRNFAFRPYFHEAMQGKLGRYYALGTTSGERGYYFASPVQQAGKNISGVVVVKVAINAVEQNWEQKNTDFMVTDPDGVVFIASQERWRLHALQTLSAIAQEALRQNHRYDDRPIKPLTGLRMLVPAGEFQNADEGRSHYLVLHEAMAFAGWDVYILADRESTTQQVILALLLTAFMLALTVLLVYLLWKNQRQRREYEQQTLGKLEAKVEERTRELRHAQEELVQAAKMAALGQLSAGINHELNNPLTAIRAYADNAVQFLDIGKVAIARSNLGEIVHLTDRMATITRQLKTFSRKSTGQIETCDLYRALDSALSISQPKLAQTRVVLEQQRAKDARYVQADLIWLEQILVNLLTNAAEAVQDQPEQHIKVILQARLR
jgi:two-component system C4-dicarboxylate transport sensor histidine kinase DctB